MTYTFITSTISSYGWNCPITVSIAPLRCYLGLAKAKPFSTGYACCLVRLIIKGYDLVISFHLNTKWKKNDLSSSFLSPIHDKNGIAINPLLSNG